MRKLVNLGLVLGALAVAGCVESEDYMTKTPSGRPEVTFNTTNAASVSDKIAGLCAQKGILVQEATSSKVICGGTMQGGQAALAQLAIGNSYSTTPGNYVQFTIFKTGGVIRVQAQQWIETQMAFGQTNRMELNSGKHFNDVMRGLMSIGGKPVST